MTEEIEVMEALNEYYRLKNKYESGYYEKFIVPIIKSGKSKREKRLDYAKLPKHECINCKRNVGTLFSVNYDYENSLRKFVAKCGDLADPCPLNIEIHYAEREILYKTIVDGTKNIEKLKMEIIKEKNNALFFGKDVISSFEKITSELKTETENTGLAIETNILVNDNPEEKKILNKKLNEFGTEYIVPFKLMVEDKDLQNKMKEAVTFYLDEMVPKLKEIQELKYDVNYVEYDPKDNVYKLIQLPNSLENGAYFVESDDKVIKFVRGVKKNQTMKNRGAIVSNKNTNKTRKNRIIIEPLEEDVPNEEKEGNNNDVDDDEEDEDE